MKKVNTKNAPRAIGPYSQAVIYGGLIYTSGQISINPETQLFIHGGIKEQTELVIKNLSEILKSEDSSLENVIKTTIFLKNMDDFIIVNEIYNKYFMHKPARSTVEVSRLPKDALIEIECIAILKN
ncbi:MAG: RidA family protein [Spirochaetaceae bacterium]